MRTKEEFEAIDRARGFLDSLCKTDEEVAEEERTRMTQRIQEDKETMSQRPAELGDVMMAPLG
jgi:hypothetical protein